MLRSLRTRHRHPADIACALMNSAQEAISGSLIAARLERLWQPSAYLGSYGDLASPQIRKYLEHWGTKEQ